MSTPDKPAAPDRPWLIRTYAGHSTAAASNALYRANLAKGQTGLSVAFDLPTQTGYDSDHILSRGEVGKVGVPVCHLGDMRQLFADIPLHQMNTSMTINATAPWLLSLYIAAAEEQGADVAALQGTVQNDLIKEYLSRGTYICPPKPSLKMIRFLLGSSPRAFHQSMAVCAAVAGSPLSIRIPVQPASQSGALSRNPLVPYVSGKMIRRLPSCSSCQSCKTS